MPLRVATTFDEHIRLMTAESPHGTLLDWWRRLDPLTQYLA